MRAVIGLSALFTQVIRIALCDGQQQFFVAPSQQILPSCFSKPGPPDVLPPRPLPPCPCCRGPTCDGSSTPFNPNQEPPSPEPCPCCKPPTGALAMLMDIVANLMNLPKGSLSKLPLCCAKDVNIPRQLLALTAPLSSVNLPSQKPLTLEQIETLIRMLKTPQALDQPIRPNPSSFPNFPQNFPQKNLEIPQNANFPLNFPQPNPEISQNPEFPNIPALQQFPYHQCITHRLEPRIRPVVDECIRNVPVYQNIIRHEEEQTVRNLPFVEKTLTNQEEQIVRNVPVIRRITRPVVETRTRHIPVIRKRIRTVVEPYTSHIPFLEKFTRPVEEMFITSVPVVERRHRPVFTQTVRQVPVTEKRLRPVVQSQITQVPVKQQVIKHFIEQRVKPYVGPCDPCETASSPHPYFPLPPTFLNVPHTPSYPC